MWEVARRIGFAAAPGALAASPSLGEGVVVKGGEGNVIEGK